MDLLIGALIALTSAIASIVGNLLASELYDRASPFAKWLVERAANRLPEQDGIRYREEWLAHLEDCSGHLGKVWHALGCFFGAPSIAQELSKLRTQAAGNPSSGGSKWSVRNNKRASMAVFATSLLILAGSFLLFARPLQPPLHEPGPFTKALAKALAEEGITKEQIERLSSHVTASRACISAIKCGK